MPQTRYLQSVKGDVAAWLESVRYKDEGWGRWPYNRAMPRRYALESSAMAIKILELYDLLKDVPKDQCAEAVMFLQGLQDPADGFFKDPFLREQDRSSDFHSWEHNWAHMTDAAVMALAALGARPQHPPKTPPFVDLRSVDPRAWILGLDWRNPWHQGEHTSRALQWYWNSLSPNAQDPEDPVIRSVLETLEHDVFSADTGLPTKRGCESVAIAMAGLFKASRAFLTVDRSIPYVERAVDSTLALQKEDGSFGDSYVQDRMTINWDALWVLKTLSDQVGHRYRFEDIREAGERSAALLLNHYRKPDGGFSFHSEHCQIVHNSFYISEAKPISDMEGTLMSLRCLSYADEWNAVH